MSKTTPYLELRAKRAEDQQKNGCDHTESSDAGQYDATCPTEEEILEEQYNQYYADHCELERRAPFYPADNLPGLFLRHAPPIKEYVPKLIYAGAITILAGDPKAGKTTLLLHALRAATTGQPFLWGECKPTTILYASEQSEVSFKHQVSNVPGLKECSRFRVLLYEDNRDEKERFPSNWEEQIELWRQAIKKNGAKVLVIDTFTAFSNFRAGEAFDPGVVQARGQAMKKLLVDTPELAIVVLHHLRKEFNGRGGSRLARSFSDIANSYALRAFSDQNALIYQPSSELVNVRTIRMEGRFIDEQETHEIELTKDGFILRKAVAKKKINKQSELLELIAKNPELNNLSVRDLHSRTGIGKNQIQLFRKTFKKGKPIVFAEAAAG